MGQDKTGRLGHQNKLLYASMDHPHAAESNRVVRTFSPPRSKAEVIQAAAQTALPGCRTPHVSVPSNARERRSKRRPNPPVAQEHTRNKTLAKPMHRTARILTPTASARVTTTYKLLAEEQTVGQELARANGA